MSKDKNNSNENEKPNLIFQNHSGPGDNISGDKYVLQAISPTELQTTIRKILTSLRYRQPIRAKEQLDILEATSNLDYDTIGILEVIKILIDIANDKVPPDAYLCVSTYLKTTTNKLCSDIAISTQIRLDEKNKNQADARKRYAAINNPSVYTNEVFYEFIANKNEIKESYENKKLQLDEAELCGLFRGALKIKKHALAFDIAEYLNTISPTLNSQVFLALLKANIIESKLEKRYYWSVTATIRQEILNLCDETTSLLNNTNGKDSRIINQAATLLLFVFGDNKPLADVCWKYISEIESQLPDIAKQIRHSYERETVNPDEIISKITKAQNNISFKKEVVSEITKSKEISADDSTLLGNLADIKSIRKWLEEGGSITSEDLLEKDFSILELKALACGDNPKSLDALRTQANNFIQNHNDSLLFISPPRLIDLANKLIDLELSPAACELLKPHIPPKDIWVSPIVQCYINALLDSQQMMTLSATLAEIDEKDFSSYIWQVKARQQDSLHEFESAVEAIESAIDIEPLSLYSWYILLHLHIKHHSEKKLIAKTLNRIPDEVFSQQSNFGFTLLAEILMNSDFKRAEKHLVNWFIADPDKCATPFTNVYISAFLERDEKTVPELSETINNCIGGVRYSCDGKISTKLLIENNEKQHQSLLNISSPLGRLLSNMSIGDIEQHGIMDIKLLEKLPPYIAAFHIASELRQTINDGSDCFHSFSLPEDPDEMLKSLERKLSPADNGNKDINSNPNIPLFMKGHRQNSLSPVKAALIHLTDKNSIKHELPNFGEENPNQIILDVYSIIYLILTDMVDELIQKPIEIIITTETKTHLENWLKDINRENYLSMGVHPDGGLIRITAEDIQRETSGIQKNMKLIIEKSKVVTPKLVDLPPDILKIEHAVDLSVLSSLKLSTTNDIPWLCIDIFFAQLSKVSNYKTVNAHQFFIRLGKGLPLDKKQQGLYLHVTAALPYPVTFEDITHLSKSKDEHAPYFLYKILRMYPNAFSDTRAAIFFLHSVLKTILINAYSDEKIENCLREYNPKDNGYIERIFYICCYTSMQCNDGQEAEYKLALFLAEVLLTFKSIPSVYKLISIMASRFVDGHFMNIPVIKEYLKTMLTKSD